nr:hypothetical protein [Burkholderia sp. IMCC1007]
MTDSHPNLRPPASTPTDDQSTANANTPDAPASRPEPPPIIVGRVEGVTRFVKGIRLICVKQMPLPGIVIFVHGVNSEGGILNRMPMHEWVHANDSEGKIPGAIVDDREGQLYLKVGGAV